jgi:hypothetical protein
MNYKLLKNVLPAFQIFIVLLSISCTSIRSGVEIKLHNRDKTAIHKIVIVVAGQQYLFGRLGPWDSGAVIIKPQAISDVRLVLETSEGDRRELVIDTKIGPDSYGSIEASIEGGDLGNVRYDHH